MHWRRPSSPAPPHRPGWSPDIPLPARLSSSVPPAVPHLRRSTNGRRPVPLLSVTVLSEKEEEDGRGVWKRQPNPNPDLGKAPTMDHALRQHHPASHGGGGGGVGGREDCWSEGASEALIEAWGERYVQLSRGNLRQKDWKEVADAVNEHLEAEGKPRKTDVQCKNRIDTLKKKYKIEKARPGPSDWAFYSRLEGLIGPDLASNPASAAAGGVKKPQPPGASTAKSHRRPSLTFTVKRCPPANPNPSPAVRSDGSSSRSIVNPSPVSSESSRGDAGGSGKNNKGDENKDIVGEEDDGLSSRGKVAFGRRRQWGTLVDAGCGGDAGAVAVEGAFGELAKAIVKFGEIYERVESSKQLQMLELERQRMEFAKELEFQRMQIFMEAQLELEKMKRPKYAASSGKRL